jgi:hypothetical protein
LLPGDTGATLGFPRVSVTGPVIGEIAWNGQSYGLDSSLRLARF